MKKPLLQSTLIVLSLEGAAYGQTWDFGAGTQNWTDPLNWSGDVLPQTGTTTINNAVAGQTPIITSAVDLTLHDTYIGDGAAGALDINSGGSTNTSNKWIFVGHGAGGVGTVNVNSGGGMTSNADIRVGRNTGTGTLNINGGTVTVARVVVETATSAVNVSNGGQLTTTVEGNIDRVTTSNFTAGSLISSAGDVRYGNGLSTINGGAVSAAAQLVVGSVGTGSLDMSSGTMSSSSWFVVGLGAGNSGTLNLSGGTINSVTGGVRFTTIGAGGSTGVVTQTNGIWNEGTYTLLGENAGGTGTYNLNGGELNTGSVQTGGGTGNLNFGGGTLRATGNNANFITANTNTVSNAGGAIIDSNGFDINVSTNISGLGGLEKIGGGSMSLAGADNTYTGATIVTAGTLFVSGALGDTDTTVETGANFSLNSGGSYNMVIGGIGENTSINGTGIATLAGMFSFDLSGASLGDGNSWSIIDTDNLTVNYESGFAVAGFTEEAGTWELIDGDNTWTFTQSSGVLELSVIPEPSAAFLGALGVLTLLRRRRG